MKYVSLPIHNYAQLSSLLSFCGSQANYKLGSSIHGAIIKNLNHFEITDKLTHLRDVMVVWNALISMYSKSGLLSNAVKVFDEMPLRDSITWNSVISGCLVGQQHERGIRYFKSMLCSGVGSFDHATLTTVMSIYVELELLLGVRMMHAVVILNGYSRELPVGNALISAYFHCARARSAQKVFEQMNERSVVTWTAMVSGLAQGQFCDESLVLFRRMRLEVEANALTYASSLLACSGLRELRGGRQIHGLVVKSGFLLDVCVESAIMDLYSKCGVMEDALQIFQACKDPDDISLTVILVGLAQNGLEERAFKLFADMVGVGFVIDENMLSAVLGAFGTSAPSSLGKQIHALVVKKSFGSNLFVSNGLINMYAKCGELDCSTQVFKRMKLRNSVSWNSMIAAFARYGHWSEALQLYEEMRADGMEPTDVTFLSLLHACSHGGSVEKGMMFLRSMSKDYGIMPRIDHFACVVDMLGRAGLINEAKRFIMDMPIEPNAYIWQALLGACSIHADLETGRYAAEQLLVADPECSAAYVLLANMFSSEGKWVERAKVIKEMKDMGLRKDTGASWIEVEKEVHVFVVEDKVHPRAVAIYELLDELFVVSRDQEHAFYMDVLLNNWGF